ncbi:SGNH/GDSL hydrolase family protein [Kribbella sandramycini]|uniref:Lysophospholipase L1-like esterase n=1 Tax=Kribbella sandramycini TaxID=60450 RepID=A0A7Y4P053_9ACTN|nr:SGNH/GDSL hydrolase family protein [Kribbella sandramycini]MBB6564587.1 lysophospholipase L1-like esterase [Kribbella sandramycini]NOL42291.1 SGNH/GDSL hydrolase family protein [Kribbella sandramycini]
MHVPKHWRAVALTAALTLTGSTLAGAGYGGGGHRDDAWVGSWATAVTHGNATGSTNLGLTDQSVRLIVRPTVGGDKIRIRLSNIYGEKTVKVGAATVAKPNKATPEQSDIDPGTLRTLTFNGNGSTSMIKGSELLSDPVNLKLGTLDDLVVSIYFPENTGPTTFHGSSLQENFVGPANLVTQPGGAAYTLTRRCCWFFLSGVDVQTEKSAGSIVVLGDSITDGTASTFNANNRWPDQLAERLAADAGRKPFPSVLNAGLAGSRLNHEGTEPSDNGAMPGFGEIGPNSLARLNEDVFAQTGVRTVITQLGVNDIWMSDDSATEIIDALRQVNVQAKQRGLRSLVTTITPFEGIGGTDSWTPAKEATRQAVNSYLRSSREFDGLLDFDKVLRDPAAPSKLNALYDSGDHIHPNDAGYQAMAASVPLKLVR